jgi:hypothetical protein
MEDFDSLNEKQLESLERGLSDLKNNRVMTSDEFWKELLSKKEQQEIILDVYREHCLEQSKYLRHGGTIQEFINKCKTDKEFSEKWGLTIKERELSYEERQNLYFKLNPEFRLVHEDMDKHMDKHNTPIKLITITYNDKTITSCE